MMVTINKDQGSIGQLELCECKGLQFPQVKYCARAKETARQCESKRLAKELGFETRPRTA